MATKVASDLETVLLAELPVLYRVARRTTLNADAAEDLVATTLYQAVRGWKTFDGQKPRAWLLKIMHNAFLASLRQSGKEALIPLDSVAEPEVNQCVLADVMTSISNEQLLSTIDQLPDVYRDAVVLCDIEEYSYEEAAEIMSIPVGTVRSRLFRGRKLIQNRLVGWEHAQ